MVIGLHSYTYIMLTDLSLLPTRNRFRRGPCLTAGDAVVLGAPQQIGAEHMLKLRGGVVNRPTFTQAPHIGRLRPSIEDCRAGQVLAPMADQEVASDIQFRRHDPAGLTHLPVVR